MLPISRGYVLGLGFLKLVSGLGLGSGFTKIVHILRVVSCDHMWFFIPLVSHIIQLLISSSYR